MSRPKTSPKHKSRTRRRIPNKRRKQAKVKLDPKFEIALKYLREGRSQKRAAEIGMVSVKRFRRFLREHKLAKRKGGRWLITDRRIREFKIISEGHERLIKARGFNPASLGMRHFAAVGQFVDSLDIALLAPFEGVAIADITKRKHLLETRPNVLLRLANAGSDAEMKIYRLID
jgi:hypothetical protein